MRLQAVRFAAAMQRIVVCDVDDAKLQAARSIRPDITTCRSEKLLETLRSLHPRDASLAVVDFVGLSATLSLAVSLWNRLRAPPPIRWVVVGMMGGELQVPLALLINRGISILPSLTGSLAEYKAVVAAASVSSASPVPTDARPFSDIQRALEQMEQGKVTGRVVFKSKL